jgi:hypothetical protein
VSSILLYHGPIHDNTYKLLVEVDIIMHNVPVVQNCDIPLVLYLVLHLCSLLDFLSMRCTEVPDCTTRYCIEVALCCTAVVWYYMVVAQYYNTIAQCCMELELD